MLIGTLNVVCSPYTQRSEGPNGKNKVLTIVTVRYGNMAIATRTIAGKWTPAQAIRELKRFPNTFKMVGRCSRDLLKVA